MVTKLKSVILNLHKILECGRDSLKTDIYKNKKIRKQFATSGTKGINWTEFIPTARM